MDVKLHKAGTRFVTFGEQNSPGFVQFDNQKFGSHLLTPESYELKKHGAPWTTMLFRY